MIDINIKLAREGDRKFCLLGITNYLLFYLDGSMVVNEFLGASKYNQLKAVSAR